MFFCIYFLFDILVLSSEDIPELIEFLAEEEAESLGPARHARQRGGMDAFGLREVRRRREGHGRRSRRDRWFRPRLRRLATTSLHLRRRLTGHSLHFLQQAFFPVDLLCEAPGFVLERCGSVYLGWSP